jgi:hypothetical protein
VVVVLLVAASTDAHSASLTVTWSAPGNDGLTGQAAEYDLRYSTLPITALNFLAADRVPGLGSPQPAGGTEVVRFTSLQPGTIYFFALRTRDAAQNWSPISNVPFSVPVTDAPASARWSFSEPRPNPARRSATWEYSLPEPGRVELEVFEVTGRRVRTIAQRAATTGAVVWNLEDDRHRQVPPGVYLVRAQIGGETRVQRIVVAR